MNNIQELITGNSAIDYINITTIIVNSIALFASAILIVFFILNIILKILYSNLQKIINWKFNRDFILFPNNKQISLFELYNDIELINSKKQIDQAFLEFQKEMQQHSKKLIIFKQIIHILTTIIKYLISYKKFIRIINNLRILYCCFSTNKNNQNLTLIYKNYYFQVKVIDINYLQIIVNNNQQEIKFNVKVTKFNHYKLCANQSFSNDQLAFINSFLDTFNLESKLFYRYIKQDIFIFPKENWIDINEILTENIKSSYKFKKISKSYWIISIKKKMIYNN